MPLMRTIAGVILTLPLLFGGLSFGVEGGHNPEFCALKPVDLTALDTNARVAIDDLHFLSRDTSSMAWLRVENLGDQPIDFVLVLVEFRRGEQYLLTMAFYGATQDHKDTYKLPLRLSSQFNAAEPLSATVLPNVGVTLNSYSPILTLSCPDGARVTLVETGFSGHKDFSYTAPGWRFDAFLDRAGPIPWNSAPADLPSALSARVSVGSTGHATITTFGGWEHKTAIWMGKQVEESWSFVPAIYDGAQVTSELTLVFRFHSKRKTEQRGDTLSPDRSTTAVFADMGTALINSLKSRVFYGGAPVLSP